MAPVQAAKKWFFDKYVSLGFKTTVTKPPPQGGDSNEEDEEPSQQADQELQDAENFTKRMLRIMNLKDYEIEEVSQGFHSCECRVNRHAATLVLTVVNKLFDLLIPHLEKTLEYLTQKQYDKISGNTLKRIYVFSSKVYISDYVLYAALCSSD